MRWAERGLKPVWVSVIGALVLAIVAFFVFEKALPGRHRYTITAVMRSTNLLAPGSPVRVGGLDVGTVQSVGRFRHTDLGEVTMQLNGNRPPVHTDATIAVRPRLFLEGNFYVALTPGTPQAPALGDGGQIPLAHTAEPVQLDQVLDTFPAAVRRQLQSALAGAGQALDARPTAAQARHQDPAVRHLTGAQGINRAFRTSTPALRDSALTAQGLAGPPDHGLRQVVAGLGRATEGLSRADGRLGALVTNLDRTLQTTAAHGRDLRETVSLLGPTARAADSAFGSLQAAVPATSRFSDALAAGLGQVPATVTAALPWLAQAKPLLSSAELRGLLAELAPASASLARLASDTSRFLPQIDLFDRCMNRVFIPTGYLKLSDGANSTGMPNYQEFFSAMVAQAAEGQASDGNGNLLSIGAAGGAHTVESGQTNYYGNIDTGFGTLAATPGATHPAYPNRVPPLQRARACATQPIPDVNGPDATGPADGSRPGAAPPALPTDPTRRLP
jgi:phospholipid/cholesterol/gamma-HCH transport system substrate-binding protein